MKSRIKTLIGIVLVIAIGIVLTNIIGNHEKKELTGTLKIMVNSSNYKYINSAAEQFKEKHHKVKIFVEEAKDDGYFNYVVNEYKNGKKPNIVVMNNTNMRNLINEKEIVPVEVGDIIGSYSGNFGVARLNESKINEKYYSLPFSSNPIGLLLRTDLLKKYGYNSTDINTWNDVINVGKGIYTKSKGKVKLLNGTGDDYNKLINLLIMENLNSGYDKEDTIKNTESMIQKLKKENVLQVNSNGEYAGAISSINGVKSIEGIKEPCEWTVVNPPALIQGANKFYEEGGDDLAILNDKDVELSKAFLSFLSNNTNLSLEYTESANVFSSYLYTYKNTEIEDEMNNFVNQSPLVVLSNIAIKAPSVQNYDEYLEINKQILSDSTINQSK
ncbi:MAG: ABC transporter substrate-binding protein [Clostridium sp.]|uniref:ABC transporter substrate-binding protein n=1 Tax=Clostridium sp. TaxID=1506 RepID=UPI003F40FF34